MLIEFNPHLWEVDPNFHYLLAACSASELKKNELQVADIATLTHYGAIFIPAPALDMLA